MIKRDDMKKLLISIDEDLPESIFKTISIEEYINKLIKNGVILEIYDSNNLVGMVAGYVNDYESKNAFISMVSTEKRYRGLGIAEKLIKIFIKFAAINGMNQASLMVHKDNISAKSLYLKIGFRVIMNDMSHSTNDSHIPMVYDIK